MSKKIGILIIFLLGFPSILFAASDLFHPYKIYPIGEGASWPEAVAIGDLNGDGRNDVVLTTSFSSNPALADQIFVFLQNPSGELDPPIQYPAGNGSSVDIGDVNHDGYQDVVVSAPNGIGVFYQNADGGLEPMVFYPSNHQGYRNSYKVRIGDFNHDGRLDVVSIDWGSNSFGVEVFLQKEDGTLAPPVTYKVEHGGYDDLKVGDANNDGLTDIVVMSGQLAYANIGVLYQNELGTFDGPVYYDLVEDELTSGVAVGDVDGDGLKDIVVTYGGNKPASRIGLFLQNKEGKLNPAVSYLSYDIPEPVAIADVNNDGQEDIIVGHGGWIKLGVYLQGPDRTLLPEELYEIPYASHYNPHGLAVADINGDGSKDVVIADYNHGLVVLYNRTELLQPDIAVEPLSIDFGMVVVGKTSDQTLIIRNEGKAALLLDGIDGISKPFLILNGTCTSDQPLPPGGSCFLTVRFAPTTIDSFTSNLNIFSNDPDENPVTVTLIGKSQDIPKVTLLTPNGGEIIKAGSTYSITWEAPREATYFKLRYSLDNGKRWNVIWGKVTGTKYEWLVPKIYFTRTKCLVRVVGFSEKGAKVGVDQSDSTFTILGVYR